MPTPPTLIAYSEVSSWVTANGTKSTASITWQTGDVIVVICISEGAATNDIPAVPTATGLTFSSAQNVGPGSPSQCTIRISTAAPGSGGSSAVTVTNPNTGSLWGFGVWIWRGSSGVGNSVSTASPSSTATLNLTPVQGDSAIMWGVGDFAAAVSLGAITPTSTDTRQRFNSGTAYDVYVADLLDQVSTGGVSYGITGGGTGPFTIGAIEIKGSAGAAFQPDEDFWGATPLSNLERVVTVY